jgi:hypothetical protein
MPDIHGPHAHGTYAHALHAHRYTHRRQRHRTVRICGMHIRQTTMTCNAFMQLRRMPYWCSTCMHIHCVPCMHAHMHTYRGLFHFTLNWFSHTHIYIYIYHEICFCFSGQQLNKKIKRKDNYTYIYIYITPSKFNTRKLKTKQTGEKKKAILAF